MILHEFPEGIVTFVLLERGGFSRGKSAWYAFLAAGLSTPLGTLDFIGNKALDKKGKHIGSRVKQ
jgi:zinc transporter ZupT